LSNDAFSVNTIRSHTFRWYFDYHNYTARHTRMTLNSSVSFDKLKSENISYLRTHNPADIDTISRQEAQLPQRNSASAAHMEGGWG